MEPYHHPQGTSYQLALRTWTCLQQRSGDQYRALSHQRNSGTIACSAVPTHWGVSRANPGHAGCYAVSLLELPASNIARDKYLMKQKLLMVGVSTGCSDAHLLSTSFSYYPSGEGGSPRKGSWHELIITWPDPPLNTWTRHSEVLYTHRFCWG